MKVTNISRRTFLQTGSAVAFLSISDPISTVGAQTATELTLELPVKTDEEVLRCEGHLVETTTGAGIPDQQITIYERQSGFIFNWDDNPLTTETTDEDGQFSALWTASEFEESDSVEIYAEFEGTDSYASDKYPDEMYYPILINDDINPFHYNTIFLSFTDTAIAGVNNNHEYYVASFTDAHFGPGFQDVPTVSLSVHGLPAETVDMESRSHRLAGSMLSFSGSITADVSKLELDVSDLSEQEYNFHVSGRSRGITETTSEREFRVVDDSPAGVRTYMFDYASKAVYPRWWGILGQVRLVHEGVMDPGELLVMLFETVQDFLDRVKHPAYAVLRTAVDVFYETYQETLIPLLDALGTVSVGVVLNQAANNAGINPLQVHHYLLEISDLLDAGQINEAEERLSEAANDVAAWRVEITSDEDPAITADRTLAGVLDLLEGQLKLIEDGKDGSLPQAYFSYSPETPTIGESITFEGHDQNEVEIEEYRWNIAGETELTGQEVTYAFDEPGEYSVVLTVVDNEGNTNSSEQTVTVEEEDPDDSSVTVQLLDAETGRPIPDGTVTLMYFEQADDPFGSKSTDDNGMVTYDGINADHPRRAGEYGVRGRAAGYAEQERTFTLEENDSVEITLELEPEEEVEQSILTVTVVDAETGDPTESLPNVYVEHDGERVETARANDRGRARISLEDGREYTISAVNDIGASSKERTVTVDGNTEITLRLNEEEEDTKTVWVPDSDSDSCSRMTVPEDTYPDPAFETEEACLEYDGGFGREVNSDPEEENGESDESPAEDGDDEAEPDDEENDIDGENETTDENESEEDANIGND